MLCTANIKQWQQSKCIESGLFNYETRELAVIRETLKKIAKTKNYNIVQNSKLLR